ncbi:hypothetical protein [Xenorhabdus innexi]|uniref:Uncharacterized protein n=1 Tax=Xenorhabdus innexi TaxID=290109 RepID=A0A1N6MWP9_9GAMM|nr:hypothetical protein [Xenorhabdus innexi]PHM35899.1 hypothetical protein Xinn_01969 [Xenorhabdus innexi]SIP73197.1 hypothetical protein XIS1_1790003 [Xenorhabdus innexi]
MTKPSTRKKSVIPSADTLQEIPIEPKQSKAPRNKQPYVSPDTLQKSAQLETQAALLRSATEDVAVAVNHPAPPVPEALIKPSVTAAPIVQSEPAFDTQLMSQLVAALAQQQPLKTPRLVTSGVVNYMHVLKDIDAVEFDQKLDDLHAMLQARASARSENAKRLQNMTLAMHIYQEFTELWPR